MPNGGYYVYYASNILKFAGKMLTNSLPSTAWDVHFLVFSGTILCAKNHLSSSSSTTTQRCLIWKSILNSEFSAMN